eukprot:8714624-Prorocentrum_lima.AAC.1
MTSSLVGSEMCIRDRFSGVWQGRCLATGHEHLTARTRKCLQQLAQLISCLLYTSDAADDM